MNMRSNRENPLINHNHYLQPGNPTFHPPAPGSETARSLPDSGYVTIPPPYSDPGRASQDFTPNLPFVNVNSAPSDTTDRSRHSNPRARGGRRGGQIECEFCPGTSKCASDHKCVDQPPICLVQILTIAEIENTCLDTTRYGCVRNQTAAERARASARPMTLIVTAKACIASMRLRILGSVRLTIAGTKTRFGLDWTTSSSIFTACTRTKTRQKSFAGKTQQSSRPSKCFAYLTCMFITGRYMMTQILVGYQVRLGRRLWTQLWLALVMRSRVLVMSLMNLLPE